MGRMDYFTKLTVSRTPRIRLRYGIWSVYPRSFEDMSEEQVELWIKALAYAKERNRQELRSPALRGLR